MKLYVMRHGFAGDSSDDPKKERDRPLLAEGRATVLAMARELEALGEKPKHVFSSPYTRASESADIVAKHFGIGSDPLGDMAPHRPLVPGIEELVRYGDLKRILIVGHVDNTTPAFRDLGSKDEWKPLLMAEIRKVKIDRKTLDWELLWSLKPSEIGRRDRK